jgi:DNA-binding NarL/FixJ family response regulator
MAAELPGDGIAAAELLTETLPRTKVVLLSSTADDEPLFAALLAGVRGYLPKDMNPDRLPAALHAVLDGEMALPRALTVRVVDELRAARRGRHGAVLARLGVELSQRESGVLELLDRGLDTHAIARELGISAVTVRRHVSEILRKLRVDDRAGALRLVRETPE